MQNVSECWCILLLFGYSSNHIFVRLLVICGIVCARFYITASHWGSGAAILSLIQTVVQVGGCWSTACWTGTNINHDFWSLLVTRWRHSKLSVRLHKVSCSVRYNILGKSKIRHLPDLHSFWQNSYCCNANTISLEMRWYRWLSARLLTH